MISYRAEIIEDSDDDDQEEEKASPLEMQFDAFIQSNSKPSKKDMLQNFYVKNPAVQGGDQRFTLFRKEEVSEESKLAKDAGMVDDTYETKK